MNVHVQSKNLPYPTLKKFKLLKPFDSHCLWGSRATSVPPLLSPTGRVPTKSVAG